MKVIDVFEQYFEGKAKVNGRARHAAQVKLTAESDAGMIRYEVSVNFFPHDEPDDFAISYDGFYAKEIYNAKGRRSKKKEAVWLKTLKEEADALAKENGGSIDWEKPLIEARRG